MLAFLLALALAAQQPPAPLPIRRLAPGVWAVLGDSGRGAEGRPNAGFVDTKSGVVVVGGIESPADGRRLVHTIRMVTRHPIRWLVLYAHHPDMQFGASALRDAGARVIAHPDTRVLASDAGADAMVADWVRVVGLDAMRGFRYANVPDRPVAGVDTLRLGGRTLVVLHPGDAHSAGDLMLWLPAERVLFTGDVIVEDGVTMVIDGSSPALLHALDIIDRLAPAVLVPGHGRIPASPAALVDSTRRYISALRASMRSAVEHGMPMRRALDSLPPPDVTRPVSLNSRRRRSAARVYLEMERAYMGLDDTATSRPDTAGTAR